MLQSISWSEFFTTLAVLVACYYAVSSIIFYSAEITSFLKGTKKQELSEDTIQVADAENRHDVMGGTRSSFQNSVPREQSVQSDELIFSEPKDAEDAITLSQTDRESLLVGTVADLLQEIKSHTETIRGWKKDEVIALLRELLAKYPQLIGTQYQDAINLFIMNTGLEHVDWEFRPEELSALWSSPNQ